jgi:hypothetical protein
VEICFLFLSAGKLILFACYTGIDAFETESVDSSCKRFYVDDKVT